MRRFLLCTGGRIEIAIRDQHLFSSVAFTRETGFDPDDRTRELLAAIAIRTYGFACPQRLPQVHGLFRHLSIGGGALEPLGNIPPPVREWHLILQQPWPVIRQRYTDPGEEGRRLRQNSPFFGITESARALGILPALGARP